MAKYHIYGIGAALVDTEVVVSDEFLKHNAIFVSQSIHVTKTYKVP